MRYSKILSVVLSGLLVLTMFFSSSGTISAADIVKDANGSWAAKTLNEWIQKGWLKGYSDGSVKPNNKVTRGEFITFINRAFNFTVKAEINFKDLKSGNWQYDQVRIAEKAGYLTVFEDNTIRVDSMTTREESAVMLAHLLKLEKQTWDVNQFKDASTVSDLNKESVGAIFSKKVMTGYPDGTFRPKASMTRAEAIVAIDNALKSTMNGDVTNITYDKAGVYGPATSVQNINGSVTVSNSDITLQNMIIKGDLVLDEGIGNGSVTMKNVTVLGKTSVKGGGANSIHFVDCVLITVEVNKKDGTVRIVAEGSTSVQTVVLQSSAKVEEDGTTGKGFSLVSLSDLLPKGSVVELAGDFDQADVYGQSIKVLISKGSIAKLNVHDKAANTSIDVSPNAKVATLVLDAVIKLLGQGSIGNTIIQYETPSVGNRAPRLVGIAVTTPPSKTRYLIGDPSIDLAGLLVTGTYSDGSTSPVSVSASDVIGFNSSAVAANQLVTVTVNGRTATFTVNIVAPKDIYQLQTVTVTGVAYGTAKTDTALGLPLQIEATLNDGTQPMLNVTWNVLSSTYDPAITAAQAFTVTGTLTVPVNITNSTGLQPSASVTVEAEFAGGTGALGDPYLVQTAHQLNNVRNHLAGYFKLSNDIDLAGTKYTQGVGWSIIGASPQFTGTFDGDGHFIRHLTVNNPAASARGLFGVVGTGGKVLNVHLTDVSISVNKTAGGIAAYVYKGGLVSGCSVTGALTGGTEGSQLGGVVGFNYGGTVEDSWASVNITGKHRLGGLVGNNWGKIVHSYVKTGSTITGEFLVGGLTGLNYSDSGISVAATIEESYADATVLGTRADSRAGGIAGDNAGALISNSYALGSVTGTQYVGGIAGTNSDVAPWQGVIKNSFAANRVTGTLDRGGVTGMNFSGADVLSSFYDSTVTLQTDTGKGTGKSTAEMQDNTTYSGWDFTTIWMMPAGQYPQLR